MKFSEQVEIAQLIDRKIAAATGFMPLSERNVPTIYDIHKDENRPVTQEDVDSMGRVTQAYGTLTVAMKTLVEVATEMAQGKRPLVDLARVIREAK